MSTTQPETTLEATIDAAALKEFLAPIAAVRNECRLYFDSDGFHIRAVDPANICMAETHVDWRAFDQYRYTADTVGIDLSRLEAFLNRVGDGLIDLSYDGETLALAADRYEYRHDTLDLSAVHDAPSLPELDLPTELTIDSSAFKPAIEYADEFAEHAAVGYDPVDAEFYIDGTGGEDSGSYRRQRSTLEYDTLEFARSVYPVSFLSDIANAIPWDRDITLRLGEEYPAEFAYGIVPRDAGGYDGEAEFVLAPRLKDSP